MMAYHDSSARAALRSLASPTTATKEEVGCGVRTNDAPSFFGGSSATQITDSPTTSPSLGPQPSPSHSFHDTFNNPIPSSSSQARAQALSRIAARRRDGSEGTPGTSEVPSLSLSNSSASDSYLLSPYHEGPPSLSSQPGGTSISSVRTIRPSAQHESDPLRASKQTQRLDAMHRAAAALRLPVEEVQQAMETVFWINEHPDDVGAQSVDRHALRRIEEAVYTEEDRLAQIASFRTAYMHAESMRSDMELRPQQPPHLNSQSAQSTRRSNREGIIGMPVARSTMPPLSPPPAYEQVEVLEHDHQPQRRSLQHQQSSRFALDGSQTETVPSPRAALESLTSSRHSQGYEEHTESPRQQYPMGSNAHLHPAGPSHYQHHSRKASGSRPLSLPDRSYRSMDDYVRNDPFAHSLRGAPSSGFIRRSVQAPYPPPSLSRASSRSPLISDSPRLHGLPDSAMEHLNGHAHAHAHNHGPPPSSSPLLSTASYNRLQPGTHTAAQRRRSGSTTSNRSSLSRRASGDILGLGIPRSISPSMFDGPSSSSSGSVKLSHEEVMARLQRKVKERMAAREAANALAGGSADGNSTSTPASPAVTMASLSLGQSQPTGRRRQGSASGAFTAPSSSARSSSKQRKPRKSASLKTLPQSSLEDREKPLPPLPSVAKADRPRAVGGEEEEDDEDRMSGVEKDPSEVNAANLHGIDVLLSAAAIADSPRV